MMTLAVIVGSSCGGDPPSVQVERVGDTTSVFSRVPSRPDTSHLHLVSRIGVFDGPPEQQFASIGAFTIGPRGEAYVFDDGVGLKHFDPSGTFVRLIARVGEGPAEVGCAPLLAAKEAVIAAYDTCNRRIIVFPDNEAPWSIPAPEGRPRYGEDGLYYDGDGELWVGLMPLLPRDGMLEFPRPIAARVDDHGVYRDTIFVPARYAEHCPIRAELRYLSGFWYDKREQWYPTVKWAMGTDGRLAFGCPRRFDLDILDPGGSVTRMSKPWVPARTTPDERAFYQQWWQPLPPLPELRPAYARVILPDDGRAWVWPEQPSEQMPYSEESRALTGREHGWMPARKGAFEVFERDGLWLGAVAVPESVAYSGYPTTTPIVIRGDTVWAVMRDSLDIEYVGRFTVAWADH